MTDSDREAWRTAYRLYDQYAAPIRTAAAQHDTDRLEALFDGIGACMRASSAELDPMSIPILLAGFYALETVYKRAREGKDVSKA